MTLLSIVAAAAAFDDSINSNLSAPASCYGCLHLLNDLPVRPGQPSAQLREILTIREHFPNADSATKLIWLALRNITADSGTAVKGWREVMNQFAVACDDRFVRATA